MDVLKPQASEGATPAGAPPRNAVAEHIRGSSLLLVGRVMALGFDFAAQVMTVRYLSKADFGAFSYAFAIVTFCTAIANFEMSNTLSRFIPLYRERKEYGTMFGAAALAFALVLGVGLLIDAALVVGLGVFHLKPTDDAVALNLLLVVALLIPVQALDGLFTSLCAALGRTRAIFLRHSVLGPGLRIAMVVLLIFLRADITAFALGYLVMGIVGLLLFISIFSPMIRAGRLRASRFSFPAREMLGFATPLLTTTVVWLLMESSDALLLGYFRDAEAVAAFRSVVPIVRMNQLVLLTFTALYLPVAARLHARSELAELGELYRQTSLWMTLLTFPIFIMTFSFARSTTVGLYGAQYADAAPIMALLALGYFFHTSLGFNGLTLKVFNRLGYTVLIDVSAAALNLAVNLLLIPRWGALGAAVGTAGTLIIHNLLKQFGLTRYTGFRLLQVEYRRVYGLLFGAAVVLLGMQTLLPTSLWVALPLALAVSLFVAWYGRGLLRVEVLFPEVRNWAIIRAVLR